jgi:hypothetical protein
MVVFRFSNANFYCERGNEGDRDGCYDLYGNFHG